jgi:hypothetical protein
MERGPSDVAGRTGGPHPQTPNIVQAGPSQDVTIW